MKTNSRQTALNLALVFVVAILLIQLWLLTEAVHAADIATQVTTTICSAIAFGGVALLISAFLRMDKTGK